MRLPKHRSPRKHHGSGVGLGGRAFAMGRKLASAELQLLILSVLAQEPHHGYRIIGALDERSNGFYVPSPGMIYPALTRLVELGHASVQTDGNRKRYHITDPGRRHLEGRRRAADTLIAQIEQVADRMERVQRALDAEEGADEPQNGPQRRGSRELMRARRDLNLALADKWDASREEQLRVVEILQRAAAGIAAKEPRR
ncbi:MAG: PadR family transcriptional regulator [Steroidobacteraceae bacterium]